jgi:AP-5 complex subunit mu-1
MAVHEMGPAAIRAEITEYVCAALPMGTISVVAADVATALCSPEASVASIQPEVRQPAWRPTPAPPQSQGGKKGQGKHSGVLHLTLNEYVRAIQYDTEDTPDICEVYGTVYCKAEVKVVPEFTISIASTSGVESMVTHASVQALKPTDLSTVVNLVHTLRFVPPSSRFELCGYKMCSSTIKLPIRGFFQMKVLLADLPSVLRAREHTHTRITYLTPVSRSVG